MKSENKLEGTLREYLREIYEIYVGSNFTEGSFYGSLKHLTEESARILGYSISKYLTWEKFLKIREIAIQIQLN